MVQHEEEGSRGVGDDAERVQALRVEGLLRREDAVGADGELGDVGVLAGISRGAVGAAGGSRAPVQNIKKAAAGEQDGSNRVGAAGRDRQTIDGVEPACVVIDLEAGDDAVAGGLGRYRPSHIQIANRIILYARRNAENNASRKGAHQKGLAEFRELHAIPSSWSGVRRQVC